MLGRFAQKTNAECLLLLYSVTAFSFHAVPVVNAINQILRIWVEGIKHKRHR